MLNSFFQDYQEDKINFDNVEILNIILILILFSITILTLRKRDKWRSMDFITTDQLRGIAILMVIQGHLWVHVAKEKASFIMSGDGVTLFLFISGFGITKSLLKDTGLENYVIKRINRVIIPYWIATVMILVFDYFLINKTYSASNIILSLFGINIYDILHEFDYVRWFITFLLFWYLVTYSLFYIKKKSVVVILIFVIGQLALLLDYYVLHFGWYQYLAFPAGVYFALNESKIEKKFRIRKTAFQYLELTIVAFCICYKIYFADTLSFHLPSIIIFLLNDVVSVVMILAILLLISEIKNYYSQFLLLLGKYSYWIFLLHGVFLMKYNPVFKLGSVYWTFPVFIILILFIAWVMDKTLNKIKISM